MLWAVCVFARPDGGHLNLDDFDFQRELSSEEAAMAKPLKQVEAKMQRELRAFDRRADRAGLIETSSDERPRRVPSLHVRGLEGLRALEAKLGAVNRRLAVDVEHKHHASLLELASAPDELDEVGQRLQQIEDQLKERGARIASMPSSFLEKPSLMDSVEVTPPKSWEDIGDGPERAAYVDLDRERAAFLQLRKHYFATQDAVKNQLIKAIDAFPSSFLETSPRGMDAAKANVAKIAGLVERMQAQMAHFRGEPEAESLLQTTRTHGRQAMRTQSLGAVMAQHAAKFDAAEAQLKALQQTMTVPDSGETAVDAKLARMVARVTAGQAEVNRFREGIEGSHAAVTHAASLLEVEGESTVASLASEQRARFASAQSLAAFAARVRADAARLGTSFAEIKDLPASHESTSLRSKMRQIEEEMKAGQQDFASKMKELQERDEELDREPASFLQEPQLGDRVRDLAARLAADAQRMQADARQPLFASQSSFAESPRHTRELEDRREGDRAAALDARVAQDKAANHRQLLEEAMSRPMATLHRLAAKFDREAAASDAFVKHLAPPSAASLAETDPQRERAEEKMRALKRLLEKDARSSFAEEPEEDSEPKFTALHKANADMAALDAKIHRATDALERHAEAPPPSLLEDPASDVADVEAKLQSFTRRMQERAAQDRQHAGMFASLAEKPSSLAQTASKRFGASEGLDDLQTDMDLASNYGDTVDSVTTWDDHPGGFALGGRSLGDPLSSDSALNEPWSTDSYASPDMSSSDFSSGLGGTDSSFSSGLGGGDSSFSSRLGGGDASFSSGLGGGDASFASGLGGSYSHDLFARGDTLAPEPESLGFGSDTLSSFDHSDFGASSAGDVSDGLGLGNTFSSPITFDGGEDDMASSWLEAKAKVTAHNSTAQLRKAA